MRSNVKVFNESVWHEQTVLDVEVVIALRHAIELVPNEFAVARMNVLKHKVDRRLDRPVDSKYPIRFLRPDDVAAGDPPAKAPRGTESLSLGQISLASPQGVFRALSIFDIDGRSMPSDDVAGLVAQRHGAS